MENPIKMDDLGVPLFLEIPTKKLFNITTLLRHRCRPGHRPHRIQGLLVGGKNIFNPTLKESEGRVKFEVRGKLMLANRGINKNKFKINTKKTHTLQIMRVCIYSEQFKILISYEIHMEI